MLSVDYKEKDFLLYLSEKDREAYKMPVGKVNRTIMNALRTLRTNEKVKALRGYIAE